MVRKLPNLSRRQLLATVASVPTILVGLRSTPTTAQFPRLDELDLRQFGITDLEHLIETLPETEAFEEPPQNIPDQEMPAEETPVTNNTGAPTPSNDVVDSDPVPSNVDVSPTPPQTEPPEDEAPSEPADVEPEERLWDAVVHYTGANRNYLAAPVDEFIPQDPPLSHMKSLQFLQSAGVEYTVDRERSNQSGRWEVQGEPNGFLDANRSKHKDGFILNIPPGEYFLSSPGLSVRRSWGYGVGPRFIFRGQTDINGERPVITCENGGIQIADHVNLSAQNTMGGLEVSNVEMRSDSTGVDAGPGPYLRYFRFDNVLFSQGFKNASHPSVWPGIGIYNNCVFARSGRGDGLTHCFYGSYVQTLVMRNCLLASPKQEGHPLKIYAQEIDVRGCTIANWWHFSDRDDGYYGDQAPIDVGVRGQSVFAFNNILRRGNNVRTRNNPFLTYRNRVFEKGIVSSVLTDFGTSAAEFDYRQVNNEVGTANQVDPASDLLYRHLIYGNNFINGVHPDGGTDPYVSSMPGYLVRNDGTIYQWSHGLGEPNSGDPSYRITPTDYGSINERGVIYTGSNTVTGVPVIENYPGPFSHDNDPAPVVELPERLPEWAQARLDNNSQSSHWWTTDWLSENHSHP